MLDKMSQHFLGEKGMKEAQQQEYKRELQA